MYNFLFPRLLPIYCLLDYSECFPSSDIAGIMRLTFRRCQSFQWEEAPRASATVCKQGLHGCTASTEIKENGESPPEDLPAVSSIAMVWYHLPPRWSLEGRMEPASPGFTCPPLGFLSSLAVAHLTYDLTCTPFNRSCWFFSAHSSLRFFWTTTWHPTIPLRNQQRTANFIVSFCCSWLPPTWHWATFRIPSH